MKKPAPRAKAKAKAKATAVPKGLVSALHVKTIFEAFAKDRKLKPIVERFIEAKAVETKRGFGTNALKVNKKLFVLFTRGTIVVKLPKSRVTELATTGQGIAFDPGHGRVMKEWLVVTTRSKALWIALAKEAHAFAASTTTE